MKSLYFILLWIAASSLQYGFHISALNAAQKSIVCGTAQPHAGSFGLPSCLKISDFWFGVVTASYTREYLIPGPLSVLADGAICRAVGGLASSLVTGTIVDTRGRKSTALCSAWLIVIVSLSNWAPLASLSLLAQGMSLCRYREVVP